MRHGKKYRANTGKIESLPHTSLGAIQLIKTASYAKFDASIDADVVLGVLETDRSKIRGSVTLPHGTGKKVRVAVFTESADKKSLQSAGAHVVGGQELVDEAIKGKMDFDVALATPEMMPKLAKAAKQLGPKGLMPNPKDGTVTTEPEKKLAEFLKGTTKVKSDPKNAIVHCAIGKQSFSDIQLDENLRALVDYLKSVQPDKIKGQYIKSVTLSSSMSPGARVNLKTL